MAMGTTRDDGSQQSTWVSAADLPRGGGLFSVEAHQAVFGWVLEQLAESGLVSGKTLGIDATTLEANAAMRSIVRRDTGEDYTAFLTRLAQASGIETPTAADLARFDRKRKKKILILIWSETERNRKRTEQ